MRFGRTVLRSISGAFTGFAIFAFLALAVPSVQAQVSGSVTVFGAINPGDIAIFRNKAQIQNGSGTPLNGQCIVYTGTYPSGSWGPASCVAGGAGTVTNAHLTASVGLLATDIGGGALCNTTTNFGCNLAIDPTAQIVSFNGRFGSVVPANGDYSFSLISSTLGCSQLPAFTGDVTNSLCALTVANGAITNAKLAAGAAAANLGSAGGDLTGTYPSPTLVATAVTPATYGSSTSIPNFTVDQKGRLTNAGGNAVVAPAGTLSGTTLNPSVVNSSLQTLGTLTQAIAQTLSGIGSSSAINSLQASLANGNNSCYQIGTAASLNNAAEFCFNQNATANFGSLGIWGNNQVVTWTSANFCVGCGTTPPTNPFEAVGAAKFDSTVNVAGAVSFGPGGTSAGPNLVTLNGSSAANGGTVLQFEKNGTVNWRMGDYSSIIGGSDARFVLFNNTTGGFVYEVDPASSNVTYSFGLTSTYNGGGIGYSTGAGCSATQITNRTTGVSCAGPTGQITLVSGAGTTTPNSFTVTNADILADDTVICSQKSGANTYRCYVSGITGGTSFKMTQEATVGTTTEAPVFNFTIMRGSHN